MAWFSGTEHVNVTIDVPFEKGLAFFQDPAQFKVALGDDLQEYEKIEPLLWRWTLKERKEVGLTFQPIYLVSYTSTENGSTWETKEGTMRSKGELSLKPIGDNQCELDYYEEIELEVPVPRLVSKIVGGIAAREIRAGITQFVARAKKALEEGS